MLGSQLQRFKFLGLARALGFLKTVRVQRSRLKTPDAGNKKYFCVTPEAIGQGQ